MNRLLEGIDPGITGDTAKAVYESFSLPNGTEKLNCEECRIATKQY
jgi:hypothetical protein